MLYFTTDRFIGRSLDVYGEYMEDEVGVFRAALQRGQVAVDIGAHVGCHSIALARIVGPTGSVIAIEPQRALFQMLSGNAALNRLANIHAYHAAAGSQDSEILVPVIEYSKAGDFGSLILGKWTTGESVPLITLDSLDLPACHLIKVDALATESDILAGAGETIRRHRPILYVGNAMAEHSATLIQSVLALEYRAYWHAPPLYSRRNFMDAQADIFASYRAVNMLCLPTERPQTVPHLREILAPNDPRP
jgi:FkbM family methyltransferase